MFNLVSFKRALKFGWENFQRGRESSWVIVLVIAVVIFLASSLFLLQGLSEAVIDQVRQQVSIAAYFQRETDGADMTTVRDELLVNFEDDIREIKIVSAEEALSHFVSRHRGDLLYQRALDQVGENPFLSSLDIVVGSPERYSVIAEYLTENHADKISKVDYHHRENVIERVFATTGQVRFFGIVASLLLTVLVVLIAFSTIKVSIHASRWEIETMKLVGAPAWFTRLPFIVQGVIAGLIAAFLVALLLVPAVYFLSPRLEGAVPGFSLWGYFVQNFFWLLGLQLLVGLFLGWISTLLAVRRHLKM